ncbi:MAG: hypothetical protein JWM68_5371 [Verrucomicrobiales bacterium]|nr:hypothetical protein [Verrucomicrobiales bacterium]
MRTNRISHDGKVALYANKVPVGRCLLALYAKSGEFAAKCLKLAAEEISGFVPEFRRGNVGACSSRNGVGTFPSPVAKTNEDGRKNLQGTRRPLSKIHRSSIDSRQ